MTLSEITKGLEGAVDAVGKKKLSLDTAQAALAFAQTEYQAALTSVKDFHQKYSEHMSTILTGFGQLHK